MNSNGYAHPEVLVDTEWAAAHVHDPQVRFIEVDVDTSAYDSGHIRGAVGWNWRKDTQQPIRRDIPERAMIEALLSRSGVSADSTVIFYGDNHNWFATFAFWLVKMYGHHDARIMNGGRKKWTDEGRPVTTAPPLITPTAYRAKAPSLMCGRPASTPASCSPRRTSLKKARSGAGTSPARSTSPGRRR